MGLDPNTGFTIDSIKCESPTVAGYPIRVGYIAADQADYVTTKLYGVALLISLQKHPYDALGQANPNCNSITAALLRSINMDRDAAGNNIMDRLPGNTPGRNFKIDLGPELNELIYPDDNVLVLNHARDLFKKALNNIPTTPLPSEQITVMINHLRQRINHFRENVFRPTPNKDDMAPTDDHNNGNNGTRSQQPPRDLLLRVNRLVR
jgi:hypothetical protein